MKTRILCIALGLAAGLGLFFPLWLLAQSSPRPAPTPGRPTPAASPRPSLPTPAPASAPASRPAALAITLDPRTDAMMIGRPPAPVISELLVYSGKKTEPAPVQMIAGEGLRLRGYSGKYPVPVGSSISGPLAGRMWAILADVTFDASQIDLAKLKAAPFWHVVSAKGDGIALIDVNLASLAETHTFYVSPQYVVFAGDGRKIPANGPFATFLFPSGADRVSVLRNGEAAATVRAEEEGGAACQFDKVSRTDLIEWEITGANPAKGSLRPILVGSEPGLVEYRILPPKEPVTSRPAGK
jgi:hypothetical protein